MKFKSKLEIFIFGVEYLKEILLSEPDFRSKILTGIIILYIRSSIREIFIEFGLYLDIHLNFIS